MDEEKIVKLLPERWDKAHKGSFGRVLVIGGSINYPGAAYLCASGVYRAGAGLVSLAVAKSIYPILAAKISETTFYLLAEEKGSIAEEAFETFRKIYQDFDVLVIGPGLGQSKATDKFLKKVFALKDLPKMVVDADGLNFLAKAENFWDKYKFEGVLTPHPGELGKLLRVSAQEVQDNRVMYAKLSAERWGKVVVLKGAESIICASNGRCEVLPFKNPAMATAGTGDVLTGVIGGFLAQGMELFEAAWVGSFVHGMAGEKMREELGDAGALASALLPAIPRVIKELKDEKSS